MCVDEWQTTQWPKDMKGVIRSRMPRKDRQIQWPKEKAHNRKKCSYIWICWNLNFSLCKDIKKCLAKIYNDASVCSWEKWTVYWLLIYTYLIIGKSLRNIVRSLRSFYTSLCWFIYSFLFFKKSLKIPKW